MSFIGDTARQIRPLIILGVLVLLAVLATVFAPEPQRGPPEREARIPVETQTIQSQPFEIQIESYGTVQPRTRSLLVAQVGGQVTAVAENFREGGYFRKGDVLVEIDRRDYEANVKVAEAGVMDARQRLQEENARAEQARKDWERLGREEEQPNDLVLRKPQVLAAEARLVSATASLELARLELERTRVRAPFDGRVLRQTVDLGQVVARNTQLGDIFATDAVEIRLPIRNRDLAFVDLPESYLNENAEPASFPGVSIFSNLSQGSGWLGNIVRTESAIDDQARQLHVVAQIDDPFVAGTTETPAIKIGQYVTARIAGKRIEQAVSIPVRSIYQGSYVYVVENEALQRRNIQVSWQDEQRALIESGLQAGDQLILTPLGQVISGTKVRITNPGNVDAGTAQVAEAAGNGPDSRG